MMDCIRKSCVVYLDLTVLMIFRTDAGYAHMGDIWFRGVKAASAKGLITPPV